MNFLTVSDEIVPSIYSQNVTARFKNIDGVLACGDLPYYYLEYIVTMLQVPCYYVLGNHDGIELLPSGETLHAPRGCVSLEGTSLYHNGLILAGLGGCVRYNNASGPQYTELEMRLRVLRLTPRLLMNRLRYGRYLDIMLTHAPPHGIHSGEDRAHRGFVVFLDFISRFKPSYLVHGHIHRSYAVNAPVETLYQQTLVINTAGYRVLSIEPDAPEPVAYRGEVRNDPRI